VFCLITVAFMVYASWEDYVLSAPPELLCLVQAVVLIAIFHRYLNQTGKLVVACSALLIGRLHREALISDPESGLWFVKCALRLYEPLLLAASLVVFRLLKMCSLGGRGKRCTLFVPEEQPATQPGWPGFERLYRKIRSQVRSRPLAALALLMIIVACFVFVQTRAKSDLRPSVADNGFHQIQSSLTDWRLQESDLAFRLRFSRTFNETASSHINRIRMERLRDILHERTAKYESRFHQLRDQLDQEALERTVSEYEVQFHDTMLCHESLIDQFSQTAATVRATPPHSLAAIPFEDRHMTSSMVAAYDFNERYFDAEDQVRIAADYDRKAEEVRSRLERLRQTPIPKVTFDPLTARQKLHSQPLALSRQDRVQLSQFLQQRVRLEPWQLGLIWDLFALKRLDGITVTLPSAKSLFGIVLMLSMVRLAVHAVITLPRRSRDSVARQRKLIRSVAQVARSVILASNRNRHFR